MTVTMPPVNREGNNVTEKDKLRRYVEGLKEEICTITRVGMVDGGYTIFAHVKSAVEVLEFELWRSRRKTNAAGSSTIQQAKKPTTEASNSGATNLLQPHSAARLHSMFRDNAGNLRAPRADEGPRACASACAPTRRSQSVLRCHVAPPGDL